MFLFYKDITCILLLNHRKSIKFLNGKVYYIQNDNIHGNLQLTLTYTNACTK